MKFKCFKIIVTVAAAGLLVGCMNRELVRIDPLTESYILLDVPVQAFVGVDILVVVDNSGSMAQEQEMLRQAFPSLIRSILNPQPDPVTGLRPHAPVRDMHLGVVSNDMGVGGWNVRSCENNPSYGDDGVLQHAPHGTGCASSYNDYLIYGPLPQGQDPDTAVVDQLAADFGCIAVLGTAGCGFEQQLEAAHKALFEQSAPGYPNAGFLRPDTILTILFITDEEDCSAQDTSIFDVTSLPYDVNLRCYYKPENLWLVNRYIDDFMALRGGPGPGGEAPTNLVVGFIIGVPPSGGPPCEGRGDKLGGCLDEAAMVETINGAGTQLNYVCTFPAGCTPQSNCSSEAFPGRRFVQVAQALGDNAVVQSICTESFVPAVEALTEKLREAIQAQTFHRSLAVDKDPDDPTGCRCLSKCYFIEDLGDDRPCPEGKDAWDTNSDTVADDADLVVDEETGQNHRLCEIPQAGSITSDCTLPCDSFDATYTKDESKTGWWYNPYEPNLTPPPPTNPTVHFEGVEPASGSGVSIQCSSLVCPSERRCGSSRAVDSKCCDINEYCYYPNGNKDNEGLCLLRRDICEQYGDNEWCPGAGPVGGDPLIGGLCCVDPESDGYLNLADTDLDGLLDTPQTSCQGGSCQ